MRSMQTALASSTAAVAYPWFDFNDAVAVEPRLDKQDIRARLLDQLESALAYLLPRGKRRGAQFVVGNVQGDAGDSLVVDLDGAKRGLWLDFATGESGDALALWAFVRGFILPQQFDALLEDIGDWLVVPRPAVPVAMPAPHDELGPVSAKWNYHDAQGNLLACVYRYDPPGGKQYRPWDVKTRSMRMPEPRPLYNLPAIAASDDVVLVEGEKCADALMHLGITATTAMGGAATAIDKTDWMPLAGKTVVVWPDHDEAGSRYADAVIARLRQIGAKVRRVSVPQDKPKKWDAADAVAQGLDVPALLRSSAPVADDLQPLEAIQISQWRALDRFTGQPQARRWLVEGVFAQAQAALVAAAGGVGKSFLLLALAREVAASAKDNTPIVFGSTLAGHGVAIYITAEDDAIEVHNRLGPVNTSEAHQRRVQS
ncbi:AAA family ATPase [Oryzisolibacter sp. LB2S]|uniref:AAA family ATPase n=1 Tax=Alicycliphilus soli TaxID=3228789 RepID=UPI00345B0B51